MQDPVLNSVNSCQIVLQDVCSRHVDMQHVQIQI
jgi:hypothetical protein